ncbi:MAG: ATP-dependent DNA helicase RecQ [Thermoguttaceae bacterium]
MTASQTVLAAAPLDAADALAELRRYFGFADFKPGQREVIGHLLAGKSAAAVFPTGGGKSLCYQLPSLVLPGLTLVVSPLIALMKDQIDALAARGIAARRLDSTLNLDEYRSVMDEVRSGRLRLLYVAPERFVNERFCETIQRTAISLFAVDEAHCISEWGHNFRPDYLRLARFAQLCQAQRVLALTATATPQVLGDICRFFRIDSDCAVRTGFYRPNLALLATPVSAAQRDEQFIAALAQREPGPTIAYVTLQRTAEELAQRLVKTGLDARAYHAGMGDDQRRVTQEWFIQAQQGIVVATIAFGMGIDKANIRYVYHYNPAKSLENYAQEVGRAGRDGKPATCEMFFCPDDLNVLENFVYGDTPTQSAIAALVDEVFGQGDDFDVSIYELSSAHDIRNTVVRTLLTYLELLGHIDAGTPFYAEYQFKPFVSSAEILRHFEGDRKTFLQKVLAQARRAKTWFNIDLDQASQAIGEPRDRIVRALDYLAEQNWLELRTAGVRQRYQMRNRPSDLSPLVKSLYDRALHRESREIQRLHQVANWVEQDACQVAALGAHFGDPMDRPCGHCSWCRRGGKPEKLPPRPKAEIDPALWAQVGGLRRQHGKELGHPRSLARFLCGVNSPWMLAAKLQTHSLYGALAHVPFAEVLAQAGN